MILRHPSDLYTSTFSDPSHTVRVGEVDVILPDMPDEKHIIGYDKKSVDQKYTRAVVPSMKGWSQKNIDDFVAAQWHRRLNGAWYFIKGTPYYVPGPACMFFDYWTKKTGGNPDFRYEALSFFWFWYLYVEKDPNLFGMFDMKPRRIGDTEKVLFIGNERITRFRNVVGGMQSYTDLEGAKNFARLAKGHRSLPFFFKPQRSGSDKSFLAFMPPNEVITMKKLTQKAASDLHLDEESGIESQFIGSFFDYESTVEGKYDGDQLFFYFLDEVFKIKVNRMNVKTQWSNIKRCLSLHNGQYIYGKAVLCSTVEEKSKQANDLDSSTVEMARLLFEQSDPNQRDSNGQTVSGLARLFRDYQLSAAVDEYGFPKSEEAKIFRANKIAALQKAGDFKGLIDLMRKEPSSIEDALTVADDDNPLMPELCIVRLNQIKNGLDRFNNPIPNYVPRVVEGDLVWKNGRPNTEVVFVPKKGGKWHVSQMPKNPNRVSKMMANNRYFTGETYVPLNSMYFRMGCDPYDARYTVNKGSDGAFAVKRRMYLPHEQKKILLNDLGQPINVEDMVTNTYVCDYKCRPDNPYDFYMDVVKTAWFWGCKVFVENDKPGLQQWMISNGYFGFINFEPNSVIFASSGTRSTPKISVKATETLISMYVEKLQLHIATYIWNNHHPRIISQWQGFKVRLRTLYDLAVATGFTELADDEMVVNESEIKSGWTYSPYESN